jgi:hypothetical protein
VPTKIYTYGYLGWEIKVDSHVRTRVMFAIADAKKKQLAWYMYSQDMLVPAWQDQFYLAAMGKRKMDRPPEIFASAPLVPPSPWTYPERFRIDALAPRLGAMTAASTWANLNLRDEKATKITNCILFIDHVGGDQKVKSSVLLTFELSTERPRSTFDLQKTGRAFLLGTERFSDQALERGPTPAVSSSNPYLPSW